MKVLVVGAGGREHALCWAIAKSPRCAALYCAPGNAGIADVAICVDIAGDDPDAIVAFAAGRGIDLAVIGPEAPLVAGLADRLEAAGITTFGPSRAAAALEGSKGEMKDMVAGFGVPTAAYGRFADPAAARAFVTERGAPIVVKTDGLAAGKGVRVCRTVPEAHAAIDEAMIDRRFGDAGAELVIEEFLDGEEVSFFALCDGENFVPLIAVQDHKTVGEGDTGPNTGGMGAYSPAPVFTPEIEAQVIERILHPTLAGMKATGRPFRGVLFAGLMIGGDGRARLLEYNIRFGDPECQVIATRLKSDLLPVLEAAAKGRLDGIALDWHADAALTVVMAATGYPGAYEKGSEIRNLSLAAADPAVTVFHAGTRAEDGRIHAAGGRVLGVTARGGSVEAAREKAYAAIDALDWPEGFCRRDIGWRAAKSVRGADR